ncbi:hypothetical protein P3T36_003388 [Kitasatospora sp. MAP12-15]|nr:hypothetical protein [Kitasatospora sp. MAP12-44]
MAAHRARYTVLHPDRSTCPPAHKYTSSGKPKTDGCDGRIGFAVSCLGCDFTGEATLKVVAENSFRRHVGQASRP